MIPPPLPRNESYRLKALRNYQILDTFAEQEFDDLTYLASQICGTPISTITLIDHERQWFKSVVGLEVTETPRDVSICGHTILQDGLMVVPDARVDDRFATNPFIVGEPHVRFYAGAPLITPDGMSVGALCVIDTEPRELNDYQLDALRRLGRQAMALLESRLDANRLRDSENRYRRLFETSQDGILIVNALSGEIEDVNPAMCRMLDYAAENFVGCQIDELETFREAAPFRGGLMTLTEQETFRWDDLQLQTSGGEKLFVELVGNLSTVGEKMVLQCNLRDITERKSAEEALRRSESLFRTLINSSWDAFHLVAPTGEILYESPAVTRMLGYQVEEMVGHNVLEFVHPDELRLLGEDAADLLSTPGGMRTVVLRIRHKDGSWRWIESFEVNLLSHPDVGALAINYRDITERKRAEEERDRFFTMSLDMLCVVGMDGFFRRLNPAFSTTLGYSEEELLGRPFIDWVHPDDKQASDAANEGLAEGKSVVGFENRYLRKDGSWCWIEWKAVALPEESLIYAAARDVTERKTAEANLYLANENLEQRVAQRTAELAIVNESLQVENLEHTMTMATLRDVAEAYRAAQQEAEAASMAKSEFMSRMSHELRTPLNAILGFGQILQSAGLRPEEHEQVGQILNGGWHLLDLINEVLDISRVEAGNLDLSLESVPLIEILAESCALVSPLAAQRKVTVERVVKDAEYYVVADRQRLKQVLINLISNGIKYNRDDGQVTFQVVSSDEGKIRLGVSDTGQGLSDESRSKLFVAFERLGASESGIDGTGLGLVLSKHLLTSMGGGLDVESTVGEGSTFWVELVASGEALQISKPEASELARVLVDSPPHSPERSLRVLVVEDNVINQKVVAHQLKKMGHEAVVRSDGRAAIEAWKAEPFDLILMDCRMTDMDGYEAAREIRKLESGNAHIPIVALTANALLEDREKSLASGMDDHLSKPMTQAQLAATLQRWGNANSN